VRERGRSKSGRKVSAKPKTKEVKPNLVSRRASGERKFTIPRKNTSTENRERVGSRKPDRSRIGSGPETSTSASTSTSSKKSSSKNKNERKRKKRREKKLIQTEGVFS